MISFLIVGLGGAVGAMMRYGIGLIPVRGTFPLTTLLINFLGAVAIGWISTMVLSQQISPKWTLFWKTGVCGGFTTFSAFSLETCTLFQEKHLWQGSLYVGLSVAGCLCGVLLGQSLRRWSCAD